MASATSPDDAPPAKTVGDIFPKALAFYHAGKLDEARRLSEDIARAVPREPAIHNFLGAIELKADRKLLAVSHFKTALDLDPHHSEARLNLGRAYRVLEQWADADAAFEHAGDAIKTEGGALLDWAKALSNLRRYQQAIEVCVQALAVSKSPWPVQIELGVIYLKLNDPDRAAALFQVVAEQAPVGSEAHIAALLNMAIVHDMRGRNDVALLTLQQAAAEAPSDVRAQYAFALSLLGQGRFAEGWAAYVCRFHRPGTSTLHGRFPLPYWQGEPLAGRRLLIWTEQGPGDEILLASMLPDIIARGARCILICTSRLAPIFVRAFPEMKILRREDFAKGLPMPAADWQASLSHLGAVLRPSFAAFTAHHGHLKADSHLAAEFRARYLADGIKPLVGIAWHSANPNAEAEKSTVLEDWAPILANTGIRFINLQYGAARTAGEALRAKTGADIVTDITVDPYTDLDRFSAQVAALDLVITVSNTTAHVAGALGRPVWTLVPAATGRLWYWFLQRTDSPWYPSMELMRQHRPGSWHETLATAGARLREVVSRRSGDL